MPLPDPASPADPDGAPVAARAPIPDPIPYPDPPLSDGVVRLRPFSRADSADVVAACEDPEISRYSPLIPFPYTSEDFSGWQQSVEPGRLAGGGIDFAVVADSGGELLGAIGIHAINRRQRNVEVGYWLAPSARGHGYISRALRLIATWVFDELGFARLALTNDPDNTASQAVARRCGFTYEGRMRSHLLVRHSGERRDSLIWSLLPGELR